MPNQNAAETISPPYVDGPSFRAAPRLYRVLRKRMRLSETAAYRTVRTLNQIRSPGDLVGRGFQSPARQAIPEKAGYLLLPDAALPDRRAIAARCASFMEPRLRALSTVDVARARKDFLITVAEDADFLDAPDILQFAITSDLIALMGGYFARVPRLATLALWWSPPNGSLAQSQLFHRDSGDDRQVKLLLNVSEVTDAHGPFTFLPVDDSALVLAQVRARRDGRMDDDAVFAALPPGAKPIALTGPAGAAALVDTSRCLHYGSRNNRQPRLMLMAHFVDFYAPRVEHLYSWAAVANRLGWTLSRLQAQVLGLRPA